MLKKIDNVTVLLQLDRNFIVVFFDQNLKEGRSYEFLSFIIGIKLV